MLKLSEEKTGVSFVIPTFNEEAGIAETVQQLQQVLKTAGIPYEVIVVNDGSTDRTLEIAQQTSGATVISHPVNVGYGASIKTGIRAASYDWIGIIDADGSYPPDGIPALIAEMRKGVDMAVGARQNTHEHDSMVKRIFRAIFKKIINFTVRYDIRDPNSGLRIFKKNMAVRFFPFLCDTFSFTTTLTILAIGEIYFVTYTPISYFPRKGKSKVKHFRDSLRTFQLIMAGITYLNPMKFFLILALGAIVFIYLPAGILALLGHAVLSSYYMNFGSITCLLLGMGAIGDIMRATRLILRNRYQK